LPDIAKFGNIYGNVIGNATGNVAENKIKYRKSIAVNFKRDIQTKWFNIKNDMASGFKNLNPVWEENRHQRAVKQSKKMGEQLGDKMRERIEAAKRARFN